MHRASSSLVFAAGLMLAGSPTHATDGSDQAAPPTRSSIAAVAAQVDRSLVHLEVPDGFGTGFLFRDPQTIVTAAHVVSEVPIGGEVVVRTIAEDREGAAVLAAAAPAILRFRHREIDLAVLEWTQPDDRGTPLVPASTSRLLPRGTEVLVHGFPGAMAPTIARGIVSAHQYDFMDGHTYYFLDAAMGSGGSGGPVTDLSGRLVGVANAVYDDGEASNFNWAFAIPIKHVEAMVPAGGVSAIPKPRTFEERVAAIESAVGFEAQVAARQREVVELAQDSSSIAMLHQDLAALLDAIGPMPTPSTAAEFGRAEEATVIVARALAERAVVLSWRESPTDEVEAYAMWRDGVGHDPAWVCAVADAFGPEFEAPTAKEQARLFSLLATRLQVLSEDARRGCDRVAEYSTCPPFEERTLDRAAVIAGYASIDLLSCQLDEAGLVLGSFLEEGPPEDLVVAQAVHRLARAADSAHATWFSLPSECRDTRGELDELDAESLRALLESSGYRRLETILVEVPSISSPEPNPEIVFALEASGPPIAVYLLSELVGELDEADIDLELLDRRSFSIDADVRGISFAAVAASSDDPGPWRLRVINAGDDTESSQQVRVECWGKPGEVRFRRQAPE